MQMQMQMQMQRHLQKAAVVTVLLVVAAFPLVISSAGVPARAESSASRRRVSWWWDGRPSRMPNASALISFARAHRDTCDSVLLNCGVGVQSDGTIGGNFSKACGAASAGLAALGVDVELWLGETDSTAGMRMLFEKTAEAESALVALTKQHNLRGINFDLEPKNGSTADDAVAYGKFLAAMRESLAAVGARTTADAATWTPLLSDIGAWQGAVDRVMWMTTYYASSEKQWYYKLFPTLNESTISREKIGGGLACFKDDRTAGWADSAASASYRLCWMANLSVPEVAFFRIDVERNWPDDRWWEPLRNYASGKPCAAGAAPEPCPKPFTSYDSSGCCTLHTSPSCGEECAEDACKRLHWSWKKVDYRHHPYTCCPPAL
eukprot:g3560.t1